MFFPLFRILALISFRITAQTESQRPETGILFSFSDLAGTVSELTTVVPILLAFLLLTVISLLILSGALWAMRKGAHIKSMANAVEVVSPREIAELGANRASLLEQAAEVAFRGENPDDVMDRARLLKQFYGDLLPGNFVERVKKMHADDLGLLIAEAPFPIMLKSQVITLLAQYPHQREQIIADFKSVFSYDFLDKLQAAHPKIRVDA